jgi:hypothetical protein
MGDMGDGGQIDLVLTLPLLETSIISRGFRVHGLDVESQRRVGRGRTWDFASEGTFRL